MNFAVILLVVSHLFAAGIFVERLRFTHGLLITLIFFPPVFNYLAAAAKVINTARI
jgi:hypothetical protein